MAYARLTTRNTSGLHPSMRGGLGFLGQSLPNTITPAGALQQALQMYKDFHVNPAQSGEQAWLEANESQIQAGQFNPYPGCTGQAQPLNLFQTASGFALSAGATTTAVLSSSTVAIIPAVAVPVIGLVIAAVGAIISVIDAIFKHHAQAVARDLNFSCSAVPAVNNAFQVIQQAVANGTMSAAAAAQALPEIYTNFMAAGGASATATGPTSIPGGGTAINDSPYCNSNCELSICVLGMVLYWQSQFLAQAAAQQSAADVAAASVSTPESSVGGSTLPATETSPATVTVSPTGATAATIETPTPTENFSLESIPGWAWIAAGILGAWAVL